MANCEIHFSYFTPQSILWVFANYEEHYSDVIMRATGFQIIGVSMVCSTVSSGADQSKYYSSASLAFMRGIHRWSVNSLHKGQVKGKTFPLDGAIMILSGDKIEQSNVISCINVSSVANVKQLQSTRPTLVQKMVCRLLGAKPSSEPVFAYW